MNRNQVNIQKTSQIAALLTKIIYIALIAVMCGEVVGSILLIGHPDGKLVFFDNFRIISPIHYNGINGFAALVKVILNQIFAIPVLILTYRIFRDISRDYTPFVMEHVKRMKIIAIIMLVNSIFVPSATAAIGIFLPQIVFSTGMSIYMIVGAVLFYFLAVIFKYGASLQQQADETL